MKFILKKMDPRIKVTILPYTKVDSLALQAIRHYEKNPERMPQVQTLVLNCDAEFVPEGPYPLTLMLRHSGGQWSLWRTEIVLKGDFEKLKAALLYFEQIPSVTSIEDLDSLIFIR